jgi:type II secretory pathway component PulM
MTDPAEYPTRVWCSMHKGVFETTPPTDGQLAWAWQEFVLPADYDRIRQLEADLAATLAANAALVQRLDEARGVLKAIANATSQEWDDQLHGMVEVASDAEELAEAARAFLAGGAA